jgi:hypothetical protein
MGGGDEATAWLARDDVGSLSRRKDPERAFDKKRSHLRRWMLNSGPPSPAPQEQVLNIYNWADYIGNRTIAEFERAVR